MTHLRRFSAPLTGLMGPLLALGLLIGCESSVSFDETPDVTSVEEDQSGCIPDCDDKECGDDGCGSFCGSASAAETKGCPPSAAFCTEDFKCSVDCPPQCDGRQCGDDGCGLECGTCEPGTACTSDGQCECQSQCDGKFCGSDGCAGDCGTCPTAVPHCTESGQCVEQPCEPIECEDKLCSDTNSCGDHCATVVCVDGDVDTFEHCFDQWTGVDGHDNGCFTAAEACAHAGRECGEVLAMEMVEGAGVSCGGCDGDLVCSDEGQCVTAPCDPECGDGEVCVESQCEDTICEPGETDCNDDATHVQTCNDLGTAYLADAEDCGAQDAPHACVAGDSGGASCECQPDLACEGNTCDAASGCLKPNGDPLLCHEVQCSGDGAEGCFVGDWLGDGETGCFSGDAACVAAGQDCGTLTTSDGATVDCWADIGVLNECDDQNPCTADACEAGTCSHNPLDGGTACGGAGDDGQPTAGDVCIEGACQEVLDECLDDPAATYCGEASIMACEKFGTASAETEDCDATNPQNICEEQDGAPVCVCVPSCGEGKGCYHKSGCPDPDSPDQELNCAPSLCADDQVCIWEMAVAATDHNGCLSEEEACVSKGAQCGTIQSYDGTAAGGSVQPVDVDCDDYDGFGCDDGNPCTTQVCQDGDNQCTTAEDVADGEPCSADDGAGVSCLAGTCAGLEDVCDGNGIEPFCGDGDDQHLILTCNQWGTAYTAQDCVADQGDSPFAGNFVCRGEGATTGCGCDNACTEGTDCWEGTGCPSADDDSVEGLCAEEVCGAGQWCFDKTDVTSADMANGCADAGVVCSALAAMDGETESWQCDGVSDVHGEAISCGTCGDDEACVQSYCEEKVCSPGGLFCHTNEDGNKRVAVCDELGTAGADGPDIVNYCIDSPQDDCVVVTWGADDLPASATCDCIPDCSDGECGDDGCGGDCNGGQCPVGQYCPGGLAAPVDTMCEELVCEPGEQACVENTASMCNETGSGYIPFENCDGKGECQADANGDVHCEGGGGNGTCDAHCDGSDPYPCAMECGGNTMDWGCESLDGPCVSNNSGGCNPSCDQNGQQCVGQGDGTHACMFTCLSTWDCPNDQTYACQNGACWPDNQGGGWFCEPSNACASAIDCYSNCQGGEGWHCNNGECQPAGSVNNNDCSQKECSPDTPCSTLGCGGWECGQDGTCFDPNAGGGDWSCVQNNVENNFCDSVEDCFQNCSGSNGWGCSNNQCQPWNGGGGNNDCSQMEVGCGQDQMCALLCGADWECSQDGTCFDPNAGGGDNQCSCENACDCGEQQHYCHDGQCLKSCWANDGTQQCGQGDYCDPNGYCKPNGLSQNCPPGDPICVHGKFLGKCHESGLGLADPYDLEECTACLEGECIVACDQGCEVAADCGDCPSDGTNWTCAEGQCVESCSTNNTQPCPGDMVCLSGGCFVCEPNQAGCFDAYHTAHCSHDGTEWLGLWHCKDENLGIQGDCLGGECLIPGTDDLMAMCESGEGYCVSDEEGYLSTVSCNDNGSGPESETLHVCDEDQSCTSFNGVAHCDGGEASTADLWEGLLAYYRHGEGKDELGNYDGNLGDGVTSSSGKYGGGMDFTDEISAALVVDNIPVNADDGYTAAAWVYNYLGGEEGGNEYSSLISGIEPDTKPLMVGKWGENDWIYFYHSTGCCAGNIGPAELNGQKLYWSKTEFEGTWQHIAVVVEGQTARYYRNGYLEGVIEDEKINASTHIIHIGNLHSGAFPMNPIGDKLDEVAIWGRDLSPAEIAAVHNNELGELLENAEQPGDDTCDVSCENNSVCKDECGGSSDEWACVYHQCVPTCESSEDCPNDGFCSSGACLLCEPNAAGCVWEENKAAICNDVGTGWDVAATCIDAAGNEGECIVQDGQSICGTEDGDVLQVTCLNTQTSFECSGNNAVVQCDPKGAGFVDNGYQACDDGQTCDPTGGENGGAACVAPDSVSMAIGETCVFDLFGNETCAAGGYPMRVDSLSDGCDPLNFVQASGSACIGDQPFSFSAWVKVHELGEGVFSILAKHSGTEGEPSYQLKVQDEVVTLRLYDKIKNGFVQLSTEELGALDIGSGDWFHVGVAWDGTKESAVEGNILITINGAEAVDDVTQNGSFSHLRDTDAPLWIGNDPLTDEIGRGQVDKVAIFREALSKNHFSYMVEMGCEGFPVLAFGQLSSELYAAWEMGENLTAEGHIKDEKGSRHGQPYTATKNFAYEAGAVCE